MRFWYSGTHKLSMEEKIKYMEALHLNERDRLEYGEDRFAEGLTEGKAEVANNLLAMGMSSETVSKSTGLSAEEIATL